MNALIIFCASYLYLFVIAAAVVAWVVAPKRRRGEFVIATFVAGAIAMLLSRIASRLYFDPRPFVTEHVKPLIDHAADNGFPSDHALLTMTLTAIVFFYNRRIAVIMLIMTILVSASRVAAKVHSPLDIVAAWAIGVIGAALGYYVVGWGYRKIRLHKERVSGNLHI